MGFIRGTVCEVSLLDLALEHVLTVNSQLNGTISGENFGGNLDA